MQTRRDFLVLGQGAGILLSGGISTFVRAAESDAKSATATTEVFGDGIRLTGVAIEYTQPVNGSDLATDRFRVEGCTVTSVFASSSIDPADRANEGNLVVTTLSPDDATASLATASDQQGAGNNAPTVDGAGAPPAGDAGGHEGGVGNAGDIPNYNAPHTPVSASVVQAAVTLADGTQLNATTAALTTNAVKNLIVDAFKQLEVSDAATGTTLRYNRFVPGTTTRQTREVTRSPQTVWWASPYERGLGVSKDRALALYRRAVATESATATATATPTATTVSRSS